LRRLPARSISVDQRQRQRDRDEHRGPPGDAQHEIGEVRQADEIEDDRNDHDGAERREHEQDRGKREGQRDRVQGEESSLLLLAVDDVQGIEQRLHRGVGAPKGNPKPDDEGRP
jgi:hypothetical protein